MALEFIQTDACRCTKPAQTIRSVRDGVPVRTCHTCGANNLLTYSVVIPACMESLLLALTQMPGLSMVALANRPHGAIRFASDRWYLRMSWATIAPEGYPMRGSPASAFKTHLTALP